MDILITHSWLADYIDTTAAPDDIAKALSLCALSVNKIENSSDGDSIYHIEVPPNRYDCLSVFGVAREVAAVLPQFGFSANLKPLKEINLNLPTKPNKTLGIKLDKDLAPHFYMMVLDGIEVKDSPQYIQERLLKSGMRPLNNIVDVTNYIMLGLGQPLHAFDFDKLESVSKNKDVKNIILRKSLIGETIVTLDGVKRAIPEGSIVIADSKKIIDLCGIMGGENSAISRKTKSVILFSQTYDPVLVRKTSMALGLRTEAVARFEKGIDPEGVLYSLKVAAELIIKTANGEASSELIDKTSIKYQPTFLTLKKEKADKLIGVKINDEKVTSYLSLLGFKILESDNVNFKVEVPSWRQKDVTGEEDLIEEIARLHGYHNLPNTLLTGQPPSELPESKFQLENTLKSVLIGQGFFEVYTSPLVSKMEGDPSLALTNPLGSEFSFLRSDIISSISNIAKNNLRNSQRLRIFEQGKEYLELPDKSVSEEEFIAVSMVMDSPNRQQQYRIVRGLIESLFSKINVGNYRFSDFSEFSGDIVNTAYDKKTAFVVVSNDDKIEKSVYAVGGVVEYNLWSFKINLSKLSKANRKEYRFTTPLMYPPILIELSLIAENSTKYAEVEAEIKNAGGEFLETIELIEIFESKELRASGKKSLNVQLAFRKSDRSLTDTEVSPIREKIIKRLEKVLKVDLRK